MFAPAPLPDVAQIQSRLGIIFPEGISDRNYLVRDIAARSIFVMLYIDAIDGRDRWLAPKQVCRMSNRQAGIQNQLTRENYYRESMRPGYQPIGGDNWYADNTREPIRDESLKDGLIKQGVVIVRQGIPTTSSKGRYALREHFARMFLLSPEDFSQEVVDWQARYLSPAELARVRIMQERHNAEGDVHVRMPNGETRIMAAGPSSLIAKAVIEEFAIRFLSQPAVLWISESRNKVVIQDDNLMRDLNLPIDQQRLLPDLVIADLGLDQVLLIFVEIVATDGPITEARKQELLRLTDDAGYLRNQVTFISAFEHRNAAPLKRRFSGIAVDSLIWCVAEPDLLIWLCEDQELPFKPDV